MKWFIRTATWCILLLFFVGCAEKENAPNLEQTFSCDLKISKHGEEYEVNGVCNIPGSYQFTVKMPLEYQGLAMTIENGTVQYTFHEISLTKEKSQDTSLCKQIVGIWEQTIKGEGIMWKGSDEEWIGTGNCENIIYTIICHKKNNRPISINTQDGLQVDFHYDEKG